MKSRIILCLLLIVQSLCAQQHFFTDWISHSQTGLGSGAAQGVLNVAGTPVTVSVVGCTTGTVIDKTYLDYKAIGAPTFINDIYDNLGDTLGSDHRGEGFIITFSQPVTDPIIYFMDRESPISFKANGVPVNVDVYSGANVAIWDAATSSYTESSGSIVGSVNWTNTNSSPLQATPLSGGVIIYGSYTSIEVVNSSLEDFSFWQVGNVTTAPTCAITSLGITPGACNSNGTPNDQTDDYYTANVTVNFTNKPATGNLVLSGVALHSSNTVSSVAVGSTTTAVSHTFTGVRLKANNVGNNLTSSFSADANCTLTSPTLPVPNCSTPPASCAIKELEIKPAACNDNGTASNATDDYFVTDVTVSFTNPPATGNLVLSGPGLHATNSVTTVAVGSMLSSTSHTFAGVRIKANGSVNSITATFSADPTCTLTVDAPSVNPCSTPSTDCELTIGIPSVPPCSTPPCDITDLVVTPGACNDNGTPLNEADDYFTANVSVTFSNKPASGNLVLSGVALHSSNSVSTVVVGSTTSATTHNFVGVKLKANGVANAITATFSADPACTMTVNTSVVPECSTPPVECCPQIILGAP